MEPIFGIISSELIDGEILDTIFSKGIDLSYVNARIKHLKESGIEFNYSSNSSCYEFYKEVLKRLDDLDYNWYDFETQFLDISSDSFLYVLEKTEVLFDTENCTLTVTHSDLTAKVQKYLNAGLLDKPDDNGIIAYTIPETWLYKSL